MNRGRIPEPAPNTPAMWPYPPGERLNLVLDSTGLSLVGAGEWGPRNTVVAAGVAGGSSTVVSISQV